MDNVSCISTSLKRNLQREREKEKSFQSSDQIWSRSDISGAAADVAVVIVVTKKEWKGWSGDNGFVLIVQHSN